MITYLPVSKGEFFFWFLISIGTYVGTPFHDLKRERPNKVAQKLGSMRAGLIMGQVR
jgi:hypothetical protein